MNDWLAGTALETMPTGALFAALISGALLPLLGVWVVLQRVVFLGITLAQVAAAGVALGLVADLPPLPLGFALCLVMVAAFTWRARSGPRAAADTALGAAFCAASALALLFISRSPADMDQVHHVLHGNLIFADTGDVLMVGAFLLGAVAVTFVFFRQILFAAFDSETSAAMGLGARRWLLLLFGLLAVALSVSMRTTGSLLTFALLVLPPMASLRLGRGTVGTFVLASLLGLAGTLAGLLLAVTADLHVESSITVALFALWPLSVAWRTHPLLAVAAAGLGVVLVLPLRPPPTEPAVPATIHADVEPVHLDVRLVAAHRARDVIEVRWEATVHTDAGADGSPRWLLIYAGAATAEVPLELGDRRGEFRLDGLVRLDNDSAADVVSAQVWTGPASGLDSLPVDSVVVQDCPID